jgi:hypothetical protein
VRRSGGDICAAEELNIGYHKDLELIKGKNINMKT